MKTNDSAPDVIYLPDAEHAWPTASEKDPAKVTKIVLGKLNDTTSIALPQDLATRFENLTHLHVWGLNDLTELPTLPGKLKGLDVRKCPLLTKVKNLPDTLEELIIEDDPALTSLPLAGRYPALWDVSLIGCSSIPQNTLLALLTAVPVLKELNFSGCTSLREIKSWPAGLERIELNDCTALTTISAKWPIKLRRLSLRGAGALRAIPGFETPPEADKPLMDYLDLRGTIALKALPAAMGKPRTVFVHGSGLELPNELFGDEKFNTAKGLLAHLESKRVPDYEIKVILLGNGRGGKSSLARRLTKDEFDPNEKSTHGIRFWTTDLPFHPMGAGGKPGAAASVRLNIWDFAGQDLYHNTHRLFLQSKALFLICETVAGDGSDAATDGTDDDGLPPGWDVDRTLGYWRGLVESLGAAPGMDGPPPMLVLRTKADRDAELGGRKAARQPFEQRCAGAEKGLESLELSAENGEGCGALKQWLATSATRLLGPPGKSEIAEGGLALKQSLRELMAENDAAHVAAELTGKQAVPPHPKLGRLQFDRLVQSYCPVGGYYHEPVEMVRLLHLSGFLYYSEEYMPEEVILDQRWAINGMYAALDREEAWPKLQAMRGRFTAADLAQWSWNRNGYSESEQKLFLRFMESCGMAFEVGDRTGHGTEYLMLRALPEDGVDVQRESADYRVSLAESKCVRLNHASLSGDSVMQLLVTLGREWKRAPVLWLWGGQFQSYRRYSWEDSGPPTFVHLNWKPTSEDSYGGALDITQYGADESFLAAVLNECRKLGGFKQVDVPVIEVPPPSLEELKMPEAHAGTTRRA